MKLSVYIIGSAAAQLYMNTSIRKNKMLRVYMYNYFFVLAAIK